MGIMAPTLLGAGLQQCTGFHPGNQLNIPKEFPKSPGLQAYSEYCLKSCDIIHGPVCSSNQR